MAPSVVLVCFFFLVWNSSRSLLTSGLGLLYTNAFSVLCKNSFINHDFQHLMLIFHFCAFKNGNSFLKTIPQLNRNRNAKITAIFELVDKPDLTSVTYLYNTSHWQLRILAPP